MKRTLLALAAGLMLALPAACCHPGHPGPGGPGAPGGPAKPGSCCPKEQHCGCTCKQPNCPQHQKDQQPGCPKDQPGCPKQPAPEPAK